MLEIIIPTHNRHHYLQRVVDYYSNFRINVSIIDSSTDSYTNSLLPGHISYTHLPNALFHEKILYACSNSDKKLIALCADDDFLLPSSLLSAQESMVNNPSISLSFGKFAFFDTDKRLKGLYKVEIPYPSHKRLINGDSQSRLCHLMDNYCQVLWSLYRKDVLIKSFEIVKNAKYNNDNFIELTIASTASFMGELNFISGLFGAREINPNEHWGTRHQAISFNDKKDIKSFSQQISSFAPSYYPEIALQKYLNKTSASKGSRFLRKLHFKIIRTLFFWQKHKQKIMIDNDDVEQKLIERLISNFIYKQ